MTVSLKHQFVSNVADSPDATLVQPSNWNAEHTLTANADSLLGAVTSGNVTEITCTSAGRALLDDADASAQRTTLGLGTISTQSSNNVSITGGSITGVTDLAVADGGTGASDAATARTNLGVGTLGTQNSNAVSITGGTIVANASGISIRDADASNVMTIAVGSNLTANTTLTLTTGASSNRTLDISATNVTVSVAGAALIDDADASAQRTTLGLGTIATQNSNNVSITGGSITGITDLAVADGGTGASDAATARTNLGIGTIATQNSNNVSITGGSITGITDLAVADGGTGASDAATARTNLGIGTIATQNANNVSITGGSITGITDLAVADGGTGASDAATARTNLGIGTMGTQNANAVAITGGTIVANASGISIRDADASNVMTIAVGSNLTANTTLTLTTGATTSRTLDISATNVTVSVAGAALIDDADAAAQRTTLGLGTIATQNANNVSITGGSITGITDLAIADGGTGASTAAAAATNLGLGTTDSPQFTAVNIGDATDTTITRVSAGVIAVEGGTVPLENRTNTFTASQVIETTDNTNAALRITQLGSGNAILVEDSANPDSTPVVVTSAGRFVIGYTSGVAGVAGVNSFYQQHGLTNAGASAGFYDWQNVAVAGPIYNFNKSKSGTVGTRGIVASGDRLGAILFGGDDGTNFISAGQIACLVDGTPGTNDMPGRLTFSTTADGSSTLTERFRIGSSGQFGIGGATYGTSGQVLTSGGPSAAPTWSDLAVGTIATQNANNVSITGGSITGITDLSLADGGTGASLSDPNADAVLGWNDTAGAMTFLTAGTGISINATSNTISSTVTAGGNYVMQVYTNTTPGGVTWTKPSGLVAVKVTVVGGGGGRPPSPGVRGGSGGGGAAIEYIPAPSIPGPVTVTVGAGGPATAPGAGGTSSFGAFCSATSGAVATGDSGGAGGAGTGGTINFDGEAGGVSRSNPTAPTPTPNFRVSIGGRGGSSIFGGGGPPDMTIIGSTVAQPFNSNAGTTYGGGASGIYNGNNASGFQGVVIVEEFY